MRIDDAENAKLLLDTVPSVMLSIREQMRSIARGRFTVPQFRILNRLRKGPMTNRDLAEWMGVSAPTMSRMIDPMAAKSLIERRDNPEDRRSQMLSLSASGSKEAEAIRNLALKCFAEKISKLNREQSQTLTEGLKILAALFDHDSK
jgi:DNA-binding MarR family transcriptional regulator